MKSRVLLLSLICLLGSACGSGDAIAGDSSGTASVSTRIPDNYCTVVSRVEPTMNPTDQAANALVPPVTDTDWSDGPLSAEVTLLAYIDFQCSGCSSLAAILQQLRLNFPENTRLVYRLYPLSQNNKSLLAAQAAEAAGLQGKFWEMKSALFEGQVEWLTFSDQDFKIWLEKTAKTIGIDLAKFRTDLAEPAILDKLLSARQAGDALGIPYLPFLVVNGKIWQGPWDYYSFKEVVNLLLLEKRQFAGCPPFIIDTSKQYIATIETEKGSIVMQLYPDKAPYTVNSFIFLANQGYFDGITFHRVIKGYLAQSGDPSGTGYGGPGYAFINETDPALKFDRAGVVGMANVGPDTNGSQFFITMTAMPNLDGLYTVFGQVIQGMNVVQSLSERDISQGIPLAPGDKIIHVAIEEK